MKSKIGMKKLVVISLALVSLSITGQPQEIFKAVKDNDLPAVKTLVEQDTSLVRLADAWGRTPFHWAAANGQVEMASYLLAKGSNINNRNASKSTPLHAAASTNNLKMTAWLLDHGADVNARNTMGWTPLFWAAKAGTKEMVMLFVEKGSEMNAMDLGGLTPLNVALNEGKKETAEYLLDQGAFINLSGEKGVNSLQTAAEQGFVRMFSALAEKGGPGLFKDPEKNRVTMNKAIIGGSVEIVEILVEKGVPLEMKADVYGWAPVHFAALGGKKEMLEYLVRKGAGIDQRTPDGKSAYNIAAEKNNTEIMTAIRNLGGNTGPQQFPVLKGEYLGQIPPGETPLIFAPGIVSTAAHEFSSCFSPDGKEFYFTRRNPENFRRSVMFCKKAGGAWTEPAVAPFSGQDAFEPFVTPDNRRLYFQSGREMSGALQMFTLFVERSDSGWGQVTDPGEPFNPMKTMHISATAGNTLYTTDISAGMAARTSAGTVGSGHECLGVLRLVNGRYEKLEKLGPPLDKFPRSMHPWISPDERYILFSVVDPSPDGRSSLYFSQKKKEGTWDEPRQVPLAISAAQPFVTPDGRYLFFTSMQSGTGNLYWVSARILDKLK
jgi:ankyrin repeat protein